MINKETYKRLTRYNGKVMQEDCRNCNYAYNNVCNYKDKENKIIYDIDEDCKKVMINRLVELEDKIMDGTLVEIDESIIGQGIIGIHHFTNGTYQLDLDENIVIGFSSDGVITWNGAHCYNDEFRNGMFFMDNEKGKAEAEAKLKELREEKK